MASESESARYDGVVALAGGGGQCLRCGRTFSQAASARRHYGLVHAEPESADQFACHVCGACHKNKQYLRNHLRTSHGIYQRAMPN